jgi:protein-S-isoprenylcysteine O-methyltransferase Ste14
MNRFRKTFIANIVVASLYAAACIAVGLGAYFSPPPTMTTEIVSIAIVTCLVLAGIPALTAWAQRTFLKSSEVA